MGHTGTASFLVASTISFDSVKFRSALQDIRDTLLASTNDAMQVVVTQAAEDARNMISWRDPGSYTETYGTTEWTWTVTGTAVSSIQGYVVGRGSVTGQPAQWTTSYQNGRPRKHPHTTTLGGETTTSPKERVVGIVTMNASYAAFLQQWELLGGGLPVTQEVFMANWQRVYRMLARRTITGGMASLARRYS